MIVRNICSRSNEMSAHHRAKSPLTISEMCTQIAGKVIQGGKRRWFAMGQAIAVRTDFTVGDVRRFAKQAKDGGQARRRWRLQRYSTVLRGKMQPRSVAWTVRRCGTG